MTPLLDRDAARRLAIGLLVGFVVFEVIGWTGIVGTPIEAFSLANPPAFPAAAYAAAFILRIASEKVSRKRLALEVLVSLTVFATLFAWAVPLRLKAGASLFAEAFGLVALVVAAVAVVRARGERRFDALASLLGVAALPCFVLLTASGLSLTVALHPMTFDGAGYHLDAVLRPLSSFGIARLVEHVPGLSGLCLFVYVTLPIVIALVHSAERRGSSKPGVDTLTACLVAGVVGFLLYHACPVAGPRFAFPNVDLSKPPTLSTTPFEALMVDFAPRNAVPSLHTTWALLLAFRGASLGKAARAATLVFLAMTLLATLVLGEHYVVDLVVAVPFTIALDAALTPEVPLAERTRWLPIATGAALVLAWIIIVRDGARWIEPYPALVLALMFVSVTAPLLLRRELRRRRAEFVAQPLVEAVAAPSFAPSLDAGTRRTWVVAALFFSSGFAGLVYEVVFGKGLALTFGSTAQASLTVLATYMGGMALGSWLGGRLAARRSDALKIYAFAELGIGVWCAASPWMLGAARAAYVAIAEGETPGRPIQSVLQLALGSCVLLPATVLMGVTMPVLARYVEERESGLARAVGLLYGANTFGAATGALLTGYVVLPFFGVTYSTWCAVALNLVVALVGLRLAGAGSIEASGQSPVTASGPPSSDDSLELKPSASPPVEFSSSLDRGIAVAILTGGGAITLALEVTYTHLLAVVAGNSVYAFSLMLFSFLVGLGLGAAAMRRLLRGREAKLWHVGALEIGVALAVLTGVFVWDGIPAYFASFARVSFTRGFGAREFVRFAVCAVAMVPPAFFIGALYPAAIACASRGHDQPVVALGRAAALNTVGNIAGALGAAFVLLPRLGSLHTVQALAALSVVLGVLPLASPRGRRVLLPGLAAAAGLLLVVNPRSFDLTALASGANVYFSAQRQGTVIDSAESVSGGLTTVETSLDPGGVRVNTMLTNGKFQGDDSALREMKAQYAFALVPLLHTPRRDRSLVVGFGVGGSTRALRDAGFSRVDIAELSPDVLRLADKHFGRVNRGVLHDEHVHAFVADGRNFLLLHEGSYQLVTIEITSIWFAGAASLYNQEFYQLAKQRLTPDGVFQQWVQLHHITRESLLSILATVHAEFPYVWMYVTASQGQIVACLTDCSPRRDALTAIQSAPGLADALALFDGSPETLLRGRILDAAGIENLIARSPGVEAIISTDDNLYLEYATPRGNAMTGDVAMSNFNFLRSARPPAPPEASSAK